MGRGRARPRWRARSRKAGLEVLDPARTARRLATILAAEVIGHARLTAADEAGALATLRRHREAAFNPVVAGHGGHIVKPMGDGALVMFAGFVDAVDCALAIPRAVAAGSQELRLRIGVNLGDGIMQGDGIYGDSVNIAARPEPLAEPGGVCGSSVVRESIRDRCEATFRDGSNVEVRSMLRPVRV